MGYITRKRLRLQRQLLQDSSQIPPANGQEDLVQAGRGLRFGSLIIKPAPLPTASAQKLANQEGIDIRLVKGSGKDGRVIKVDVLRHLSQQFSNQKAADTGEEE